MAAVAGSVALTVYLGATAGPVEHDLRSERPDRARSSWQSDPPARRPTAPRRGTTPAQDAIATTSSEHRSPPCSRARDQSRTPRWPAPSPKRAAAADPARPITGALRSRPGALPGRSAPSPRATPGAPTTRSSTNHAERPDGHRRSGGGGGRHRPDRHQARRRRRRRCDRVACSRPTTGYVEHGTRSTDRPHAGGVSEATGGPVTAASGGRADGRAGAVAPMLSPIAGPPVARGSAHDRGAGRRPAEHADAGPTGPVASRPSVTSAAANTSKRATPTTRPRSR